MSQPGLGARATEQDDVPSVDPAAYNAFVESATLRSIDLVELRGERRGAAGAPHVKYDLTAGYQVEDRMLYYRFDAVGRLLDTNEADQGEVAAAVVVAVETTIAEPEAACVEMFGALTASVAAYPYVREALASTALRLGFPGVLLPFLVRPAAPTTDATLPGT